MTKALKTIVVEDNRRAAAGLARSLRGLGHEICGVAHDVAELVVLLGRHKPDLLMLDLNLGARRDGLGVATALEAAGPLAIVFVARTAEDWQQDEIRAIGSAALLLKPFKADDLETAIALALRRTRECGGR